MKIFRGKGAPRHIEDANIYYDEHNHKLYMRFDDDDQFPEEWIELILKEKPKDKDQKPRCSMLDLVLREEEEKKKKLNARYFL